MDFAQIVTVVAASSAAGKKIFLPGFLFSLLVHLGLVKLPGEIQFLSTLPALVILGVLAAAEIAAEFFPGVGSTMQSVKVFVAPVASALLAYCMIAEMDTGTKVAIMLVAAACGEAVQLASSGLSMASVQLSGGGGDPLVNIEETVTSSGMVLLAVFLPILAAVLIVLIISAGVAGFLLYRRYKRIKAEKRKAQGERLMAEQKRLLEEIHALNAGIWAGPPLSGQEKADQLESLNRKLTVNKQAIFDYEAQSYFPVPPQYRKPGHLYAKSKRLMLVVSLLSILPGLGHIYVGQWQKGIIFLIASVAIDFILTPVLIFTFLPAALFPPLIFRCIIFTDLEMIRRKLNDSMAVKPFEFF